MCSGVCAELLDLSGDLLILLTHVIGEDNFPRARARDIIIWKTPVDGAAANLQALCCTCRELREVVTPQLKALRRFLLERLKEKSDTFRAQRLNDDTLLLWRAALLGTSEAPRRQGTSREPRTETTPENGAPA